MQRALSIIRANERKLKLLFKLQWGWFYQVHELEDSLITDLLALSNFM